MINELGILQRVRELGGNRTIAEVRAAVATKNRATAKAKHSARFSYEVWDKVTPINGCPAEAVLARPDCKAGGEIYLIKEDGVIKYLQPHAPNGAKLDKANVASTATKHVDEIVEGLVDDEIVNEVLLDLL